MMSHTVRITSQVLLIVLARVSLLVGGCTGPSRVHLSAETTPAKPTPKPTSTMMPTSGPVTKRTSIATGAASEEATAAPTPTPTSAPAGDGEASIPAPEGWVAYHGVSNEFVLYHPPNWEPSSRQQVLVGFYPERRFSVSVIVYDCAFLESIVPADSQAFLNGWVSQVGEVDPAKTSDVIDEYRLTPLPMAYKEYHLRQRTYGDLEHHVSVHRTLADGGCVFANVMAFETDLTHEAIDTFLNIVATVRRTPEQVIADYVCPRDLVRPDSWPRRSIATYDWRMPSSWEIMEEDDRHLHFDIPRWGTGTIFYWDEAPDPGRIGDRQAIDELLAPLEQGLEWMEGYEVIGTGSREDPIPHNYAEVRLYDGTLGAWRYMLLYEFPVGSSAIFTANLQRLAHPFAPVEQDTILQVFAGIADEP